ncbi:MAG: aldose 1-epimerase, partial [Chloroflexota bacterium]
HELLYGGEGPHDPHGLPHGTGCFLMAPWPNRIRHGELYAGGEVYQLPINSPPHAIHGLVRQRQWEVTEHSGTFARMSVSIGNPWPFEGMVHYEAALEGASVVQTLTVEAADDEDPFPAGFGWHPWFRRDLGEGPPRVAVPGQELVWEMDKSRTTTGRTLDPEPFTGLAKGIVPEVWTLGHCIRIKPGSPVTLDWPEGVSLEITSAPEVSHVQAYTPEHAVCMEPQSCTVDAFRLAHEGVEGTGTAHVSPGRPFSGWTRWSWSVS